jgi:hypothetical protein
MSWRTIAVSLALLVSAGCASQDDINEAISDDLRFTGKLVGFSLEQGLEAIDTRLAILRAFEGDPRQAQLEKELGTVAELQARRDRLRDAKRSLIEENKKLRARYRPSDEQ